jgi:hypothetical protein
MGRIAPPANRKNDVIAAVQAEPPSSDGSMLSSSRASVSSAEFGSARMPVASR